MTTHLLNFLWTFQLLLGISLAIDPSENEIHNHHDDTHHPNPKSPASKLPSKLFKIIKL